jgi:hypothetical protein
MSQPTLRPLKLTEIQPPAIVYLAHCRAKPHLAAEQFLIIGHANTRSLEVSRTLVALIDQYDVVPIIAHACPPEEAPQLEQRLHETLADFRDCPRQDFDGQDRCYQCAFDHEVLDMWDQQLGSSEEIRKPCVYLAHFRAKGQDRSRAHHCLKIGTSKSGGVKGRYFDGRYPQAAAQFDIVRIAEVQFKDLNRAFEVEAQFEFDPSLRGLADVSARGFGGEGECYQCCQQVYATWNRHMRRYGWCP